MTKKIPTINTNKQKKLNDRQMAYVLMRKQDVDVKTACKVAGYHPRFGYELEKKLKNQNYDLTSDFWLSKSKKALKNILSGKVWGEIKQIKDSTALTACQMVFDRAQPIVHQSQNVNLNASFDLVDLSKYKTSSDEPMS